MDQYGEGRSSSSKGCFFYGCMITLAIAAVLVVAGGGLVWYGYKGQAAVRDVADAYLEATEADEYERAYTMLAPTWRETTTLDSFVAGERQKRASLGDCDERRMASINVHSTPEVGTVTDVGYDALCTDRMARITVTLTKHEGQWMVQGVEYGTRREFVPLQCAACGTVNPPGSNFCSQCGQTLEEPELPPVEAHPAPEGPDS